MPISVRLSVYADDDLVFIEVELLPCSRVSDAGFLVAPFAVDELELLDVRAASLASDRLDAGYAHLAQEALVLCWFVPDQLI